MVCFVNDFGALQVSLSSVSSDCPASFLVVQVTAQVSNDAFSNDFGVFQVFLQVFFCISGDRSGVEWYIFEWFRWPAGVLVKSFK